MPLTRLDNLISSKTGKYLYVSPDDFNATDALSNRGNSPVTPFKSIQRAFLEIARYSYLPGFGNDRFDQFSIMLMPGIHYIDNRPGVADTNLIDVFGFDQANNEWTDNSILDISNPDNVLYKFNNTEGGAIIPRGSSLVGYDLRRTVVRPLYVPDPSSVTVPRSAIFNVTGGCYFWQFTIKDGQTTAESPLYNAVDGTGEVYYDPNDFTKLTAPNYSHHKLTVFEYADTEELGLFYRKIAKGFSDYQPTIDDPGEFDFRIQENRIVGPLSDSRVIESLKFNDATTIPSLPASTSEIEVTTKVDHGYFAGQFVAISNTEIDSVLEGIFPIKSIDQNDPRKFTYEVAEVVSAIGTGIAAGQTISVDTTPALGANALTLAEVDSVESASPYVFNCSIRSTWGICGIWANGLKATGFKSMVIAQYTGVSLQKDDRAFIRYDEYSNTWNQASLTDAFATVPYHTKGDSYWKDDWRNFHVRASEDAFIQNVSIFAVGFADHFLMESGGDMSITNSNSNFGNTSLHAIGFKGFAFNQDKAGYITDIIPPKVIEESEANTKKVQYYTIDIQGTIQEQDNFTKLYLGSEDIIQPIDRPAVTIQGYRLGAKSDEKLYVKLDPATAGGTEEFNVSLEPTGFVKYIAAPSILNPSGFSINSTYADAANLIESNRRMIQEEVFGYILEKYPRLQNISYVNPGRDPQANRYFDARNLIVDNRQQIVATVMQSLLDTYGGTSIQADEIGFIVDAVAEDLRDGGNYNIIEKVREYFNGDGTIDQTYLGSEDQYTWALARARDLCKQAIANLLNVKADLYDPSNTAPDLSLKLNNPCGPIVNGYTGSEAEEAGLTTNGVSYDLSSKDANRYKTTYNLIENNRDFILDNALCEIAVYETEAPFFYFPEDDQETSRSRFKSAYRFIRRNSADTIQYAIDAINAQFPTFVYPNNSDEKCRRDLGYFIEAVGMDIFLGGNRWTRDFISQYFSGTYEGTPNWVVGGLQGEEAQSIWGFNAARDHMIQAVSNQLTSGYNEREVGVDGDPGYVAGISPGEAIYGDGNGDVANTDPTACTDVQNAIASLTSIVTQVINQGNDASLTDPSHPNYVVPTGSSSPIGESKCRRDIGHILDAVQQDLWFGGNEYCVAAARAYFMRDGAPRPDGLVGEQSQSITAFKRVADAVNRAINNQLHYKDNTITLDNYGDPVVLGDIYADGYNQLIANKEFIAEEAYQRMLAAFPSYEPQPTNTKQDCLDDVYNVLDQVAWNLKFGGNSKTYDAAEVYVTNIFAGLNPERFTPTDVSYDPATGVSVFNIPGHGMTTGDYIKIADNSITFTCELDNNATQHTYPRPGSDPYAGQWIEITAHTLNTITVNVGVSSDTSAHTFVSAATDSILKGVQVETFLDPERDEAARVFVEVNTISRDVIRNRPVSTSPNNGISQVFDNTLVEDWDSPQYGANACAPVVSAFDTLMGIIIQSIGTDAGVGDISLITRTEPAQPTTYALHNCSDVLQTVDTLIGIITDIITTSTFDPPPIDHGEWDCANVRSTIEVLFDIALDAFTGSNLEGLPVVNRGSFITDAEASKCFRDVSYIVDAVVNDLRLGGNINSVQAGEAYYVGNQLEYIDGEKTETIDAWNYVGQMATAAMRNFDFLAYNCTTTAGSAIVDIGDTRGVLIGMSVAEYDETDPVNPAYVNGLLQDGATRNFANIPEETYVKRIVSNTEIELGIRGSKLDQGASVLAQVNSTTTNLYFVFPQGSWADTEPTTVTVGPESEGPDVIQDTLTSPSQRECAGTADAIETLIGNITTIINSGLGSVTRVEQTANISLFASRATVFTINTSGTGVSNPHDFETGTPVRLVPRPRFDVALGKFVDVDKRLVRLPNGFDTNTTYYVIAPGRTTAPNDFSNTTFFNGSDQTKLMLATSRENAAAGIYLYSSESESIDKDVEIDIYQFVLDEKYDLHNYKAKLTSAVNAGIETDVPHIFDVPFASVTPHKVFFREVEGGTLPEISTTYAADADVAVQDPNDANFGKINPQIEFFARYQNDRVFTIHKTHADAINNVNPITFVPGQTITFNVYANKRRSPVKFDPAFSRLTNKSGKWYVNCKDEGSSNNFLAVREQNIFWRIKQSDLADRNRSTDTWFTRLEDERGADDRTYKIRYVIPKYIENARDPINGFVIKTRTDDTRKLVPQKLLLKPVAGTVYGARFENPRQAGEFIGVNQANFDANSLNIDAAYDPYLSPAFARFNSGIQATIQSARYVEDTLDPTIQYLEMTVFDHTVDTLNFSGLRNESFTTVKINAPQGGEWTVNKTESVTANQITWSGNSTGLANLHAYMTVNGEHYLILKNIRGGKLEFSEYYETRFQQGSTFATMLEDQDMGKSLPLKTLIRKNYPEYFYKQNGANVYTITPGDRIQDDAGIEYYVESVEDAGIIDDTFYVFSYETLQRRIAGQQDGVYYLSCLRGNISPFPTGAGAGGNFRKFRFSQPVSRLYPLDYKNDPLWFQKNGTSAEELALAVQSIDPPATYSAADNYIHGLVTTNDYKNSVTRELVEDFTNQPAFVMNDYSGDNAIQAQSGNATSGSEDRKIKISGNSTVLADQKYYVELRRPSIARAGNHTFEYLGFGPGNYSTGLPARQEIVLTPTEDFYAQSKKQDAGIVFYTGLNSNGDLYIGNRKINAITGEETFLEAAVLESSADDDEDIGNLVTTFDTPVTFNQNITVVGGDGSQQNVFQSPVVISVQDNDLTEVRDTLIIRSNVSSVDPVTNLEQDESLDRTAFKVVNDGDIRISKNRVQAAIFGFNARGTGQGYQIQTHITNGLPSNITPNNNSIPVDGGDRVYANQFVSYNGVAVKAGDILLKGVEVGKTGSWGWIYANYYQTIPQTNIFSIEFDGTNIVKLTFVDDNGVDVSNSAIGITSGSQIRVNNYPDSRLNSVWQVYSPNGDAFNPANNYVHFQVTDAIPVNLLAWRGTGGVTDVPQGQVAPTIDFSNSNWKEMGVVGAEALRTNTETYGDFKLGINTIARAAHIATQTAWISDETDPRANLDVVGNVFISGKTVPNFLTETTVARTENPMDNALLVGGDSTDPDDDAVLRVMTTNGGRLGINTSVNDVVNPQNNLDQTLVVVGTGRITGDTEFSSDIQVNGGDLTTTNNTFNFVPQNANILNWAGEGQIFNFLNNTSVDQSINIANSSDNQTIQIGNAATETSLRIHRNSTNAIVDIASVSDDVANNCEITLGGAWGNTASFTEIGTRQTLIAGELEIGTRYGAGTSTSRLFTQTRVVDIFDGDQTNTVNFAINATQLQMGSTGGSTTVRNTLNVLASAVVEGNIRLDGGLNAGILEIGRGKFGTTIVAHNVGGLENPNIDFYKYQTTGKFIDTAGVSTWGSNAFLLAGGQIASIDTIVNNGAEFRPSATYSFLTATTTGVGVGATFTVLVRADSTIDITVESPGSGYVAGDTLTITNDQLGGGVGGGDLTFNVGATNDAGQTYFLPITTPTVTDFRVGDLLLIDRGDPASPDTVGVAPNELTGLRDESQSEIVRVIGLANVANPADPNGYRLIVSRGQEGTGVYDNHPDNCVIAKLVKQSNASFITGSDLDLDGNIDIPESGIGNGTGNVRIGVAEFGGTISTRDLLRLTGTEFVSIESLITTSPQSLSVNDGGDPAAEVFKVESTTGDTYIFGDILAGTGFNRFTVDSDTGNTVTQGTLTTNNTITLRGSTFAANVGSADFEVAGVLTPFGNSEIFKLTPQGNTEFLTLTNGGNSEVQEAVTFQVDTATGSIFSLGDMRFYGKDENGVADQTVPRLEFINSSGDFTVYGSLSALGSGPSTFGGSIVVNTGGLDMTFRDGAGEAQDRRVVVKDENEGEMFSIESDGAMQIAGINNYFTRTGGPKWVATSETVVNAEANVNYFVNATGNTLFKLPSNPLIGDTIRIIDISGALTYNLSLVVRAPDDVKVQKELSNTGSAVLIGVPPSAYAGYNGGELVVQTPNAAFGLVYAGSVDPDGNSSNVPSALTGWYLMDV
jgi:hypothetical protein